MDVYLYVQSPSDWNGTKTTPRRNKITHLYGNNKNSVITFYHLIQL